ncbi:MAG: thiamine diphosphokinase [Spirochaetota bacterium]
MKKAAVFLNGEFSGDAGFYRNESNNSDIFCADGGAGYLLSIGLLPLLVVGDMDSIPVPVFTEIKDNGVQYEAFPPEKDKTDAELLLESVRGRGYSEIEIFGGFGKRLDHQMGNLGLLEKFSSDTCRITMRSPGCTVEVISGHKILVSQEGKTVSLISLDETAVVSLAGFRYPLNHGDIFRRGTKGISNVVDSSEARIEVFSGKVMMIINEANV